MRALGMSVTKESARWVLSKRATRTLGVSVREEWYDATGEECNAGNMCECTSRLGMQGEYWRRVLRGLWLEYLKHPCERVLRGLWGSDGNNLVKEGSAGFWGESPKQPCERVLRGFWTEYPNNLVGECYACFGGVSKTTL
jgi:hypothetical protein